MLGLIGIAAAFALSAVLLPDALSGSDDDAQDADAHELDTDQGVWGTEAGDILTGGAGHDKLMGDDGDDRLIGGAGNDTIYGYGSDWIDGGSGADHLTVGHSDQDTTITQIINFQSQEDRLLIETQDTAPPPLRIELDPQEQRSDIFSGTQLVAQVQGGTITLDDISYILI